MLVKKLIVLRSFLLRHVDIVSYSEIDNDKSGKGYFKEGGEKIFHFIEVNVIIRRKLRIHRSVNGEEDSYEKDKDYMWILHNDLFVFNDGMYSTKYDSRKSGIC